MNFIKIFMTVGNHPTNNFILKSGASFLIVIGLCASLVSAKGFVLTPNSFDPTAKIADDEKDFSKGFREGRDLIDEEEWAQAAKKFNEIVTKFPDHKSADAALYWLAFCYKKQKMFKEAEAVLDRLLERFPASSWANDARVMKMEIAAPLGKWNRPSVVGTTTPVLPAGVYTTTLPSNKVNGAVVTTTVPAAAAQVEALTTYNKMNGAVTTENTPLDREDEIKIAAFQGLFSADAKRGIEAMNGILRADSKASETLKIEVLRVLRRPRLTGNFTTTPSAAALISNAGSLNKEVLPLLRETLISSFKDEKNAKIRKEIIYTLANLRDEQSVDYLARLYQSETDREVKRAIINGFGSFAGIGGFLIARAPENNQNPNTVVSNGSVRAKGIEFARLLEIFKTEKDAELKTLALTNLQRFESWSADREIVETLIEIYDSETNENLKKSVIQSLARINQAAVLKKLFDIAKNDKSNELRLEAIYALRSSQDPQALKFLEELLK